VRVRISDTGTGMPADVIEHVFEPFFTTKEEGTGTGLGLATVYGILAQAEGQIQIYSEPGTGTTFSITLPVTAQELVPLAAPVPYRRSPRGETVLVVEDEEALRQVTQRIFARNGYHVITAANGPQALDIARAARKSRIKCGRSSPVSKCSSCPATPGPSWPLRAASSLTWPSSRSRSPKLS
jgi:two-component system cell cycle sensor histidine kinase/response regulator CckA